MAPPASKVLETQDKYGAKVGGQEAAPDSQSGPQGKGKSNGAATSAAASSVDNVKTDGDGLRSGKESDPTSGQGTERHGTKGPSTRAIDVQGASDKYGAVVGSSEEQDKLKSSKSKL
ncbi:uncharacterized protein L969DRAFT_16442 [Mixia osmundae IAM 14324]|uniref:Uncharacterized protein n=1 Tax=Mixia osmundae (strain CBS 9802 / IAM 14324 / JCM 22182 / KY 12970) TaxID=764103 RepID=G7DUF8_MIXOS|nr:uncharacterized protein L969DRAFT_16442 [Mixia osmundae IAM 14324]KEI41091.1 hypothetical protein L969DRAFT_16442 [Mixia osmundae IAM 14324]GAA94218.1 hypothetical protein E5Q_00867 [Mixia osmundae IAM 14324]